MSEQSKSSQAPDRTPRVVIIGAGIAGVQTAVALREQGWRGAITLLGDEPHQPYDRPPLSKAVLLGKAEGSTFDIDFAGLDIELRLGHPVTALVPDARLVETADGPIPYDYAVLATGAEPIVLPGSEGMPGVHLLRTLDDAERLRPVLAAQHEIVVVGPAGSAPSSRPRPGRRAARSPSSRPPSARWPVRCPPRSPPT
ncbi:hypothetical protein Srufu_057790 [Streptomyces libani subsp. rufus]|nr:hypothetical protein Srufu_057790 [Streptomyces libani subsp. rufus]